MRFTALQAVRLTGASRPQLDAWECAGLIAPDAGYGFGDLVAVRLILRLLEAGLSLARIRPAVAYLSECDQDLDRTRLVTDGNTVRVCSSDAQVIDAIESSPVAVVVNASPLISATRDAVAAFDAERQGFVATLRAG
ncbi:MAG: MerR family transcriptional regulator [Acidimicrobiia bacterium]